MRSICHCFFRIDQEAKPESNVAPPDEGRHLEARVEKLAALFQLEQHRAMGGYPFFSLISPHGKI